MPRAVFLRLPDDLVEDLERFCPRTLSLTTFCAYLIELGIDRDTRLSAYHVGAGNTGNPPTKVQPSNEDQKLTLQASTSSEIEPSPPDNFRFLGDGVGKGESEGGTPRKPLSLIREIPDALEPFTDLIEEFWRVKKGSKSSNAWALLMTELQKINASYGKERTEEQLQLGINGLWKGITMRNFQRFETPSKGASKEPEHRHPASRVFTAEKGFEDGPASNPALEGLF